MRDCATEGVFLEEPARKQAALWECYRGLPRPSSAVGMLPRAGRRQQSAAGSHEVQRGEDAELRGQAAGQAVILKLPAARGAPEVDERVTVLGGGARGCQRYVLVQFAPRNSSPTPRAGLTSMSARSWRRAARAGCHSSRCCQGPCERDGHQPEVRGERRGAKARKARRMGGGKCGAHANPIAPCLSPLPSHAAGQGGRTGTPAR